MSDVSLCHNSHQKVVTDLCCKYSLAVHMHRFSSAADQMTPPVLRPVKHLTKPPSITIPY